MEDIKAPYYETDDRDVQASLEIRIQDFRTNTAPVYREIKRPGPLIKSFYVMVIYSKRADENTEGWLVVYPNVDVSDAICILKRRIVSCVVSIIDVEGKSRFSKTFVIIYPSLGDYRDARYLERSFILDRADELLPEGVLTMRCEFHFTWSGLETSWETFRCDVETEPSWPSSQPPPLSATLKGFLSKIPQSFYFRNGAEAEDSSDIFTLFDFSNRVFTLAQSHQSKERFGVDGIPPASSTLSSDSKEESSDAWEHIWIFDTHPNRFLLSLEEREDNVGFQLLEASPVIRRMVNTDMRENSEKRVYFPEVDSRTFIIVLYFLENKKIPPSTFRELVDVYQFSYMYAMEGLQQKCSEEMVRSIEFPDDLEELKRMASLYDDQYLSSLLDSRWREFENSLPLLPRRKTDDRPDSDSYM
ncbi:hypothetical protein AVEN_186352-1 [Araneus ventricosus]|uniref:BTB domain-containing protein n=1 Tax=Araneus ventricosus TaxID=182803 RepID=A0A4Y2QSL6_ARAVE|nr:hypothetical protein AVEN_76054-1 [Araneus ventricosus]GBN66246.1 hypothetical protein AVEN_186352-1 [Araneus ventricosus]